MYISRVPLNMARYSTRRLVSSPYRLHAAVEASFPPDSPRTDDRGGRILWRLDQSGQGESLWLYVVSPERPDFTAIEEQAGWPMNGSWQTRDYSPLLQRIAVGQKWQFRLRANPVRKVSVDRGRNPRPSLIGKNEGEVTVAYQMKWLITRAKRNGFALLENAMTPGVPDCLISQRRLEHFRRKGATVTLRTCEFDGTLEVIDSEAFRSLLVSGIGRARGFGCGLLTVAPIPSQSQSEARSLDEKAALASLNLLESDQSHVRSSSDLQSHSR